MMHKVGVSEASSEAMNVVAEQRKMLDGIKADAARLGEKDATKDDHFLQVAGSDSRWSEFESLIKMQGIIQILTRWPISLASRWTFPRQKGRLSSSPCLFTRKVVQPWNEETTPQQSCCSWRPRQSSQGVGRTCWTWWTTMPSSPWTLPGATLPLTLCRSCPWQRSGCKFASRNSKPLMEQTWKEWLLWKAVQVMRLLWWPGWTWCR